LLQNSAANNSKNHLDFFTNQYRYNQMNKFRSVVMWAALMLIIALVFFSIYGAFLGSIRAQNFFNSLPLAIYWFLFSLTLIAGFVTFRKLIRVPGLWLIHLGCILVLGGAMYGSEAAHRIQRKVFGIDKIRKGQMLIYEGQQTNQVELEKTGRINELLFSLRLKDFRIEYYEPKYLYIQTREGDRWEIPVELNTGYNLGSQFGKVKIVREFRNFKITLDNGTRKIIDSNEPGRNPALEVKIEYPDGTAVTRYVFERFGGHTHQQDKFLLSYKGVVRDYISDLAIVENGKPVAEKNVEVNHPLHFGGYYFYQHSYDDKAGRYTVLAVVSDTGLPVVYVGYLMLGIGVFWHFWLRHLFRRTRNKTHGN